MNLLNYYEFLKLFLTFDDLGNISITELVLNTLTILKGA